MVCLWKLGVLDKLRGQLCLFEGVVDGEHYIAASHLFVGCFRVARQSHSGSTIAAP